MADEKNTSQDPSGLPGGRKPTRPLRQQIERMVKPTVKQVPEDQNARGVGSQQENDDDFDEGVANSIVIGIIVLGLLIGGFFFVKSFFAKKPIDPAYSKIEGIKRIQDLTLVKHYYESVIPVGKPLRNRRANPKLEFLIMAPMEVRGYMNLSKMRFEVGRDSLITVDLPDPQISKAWINLDKTTEYTVRKNFWQRLFEKNFDKNANYLTAYDQIRTSLDSARLDVENKAVANGILEDTEEKAEDYIRNIVSTLGYRVEFIDQEATFSVPDSLRFDDAYEKIMQEESPAKRKSLIRQLSRQMRKALGSPI